MTVLLTGFDPFGGRSINVSWEIAQLVSRELGEKIVVRQLPTVFGSWRTLDHWIKEVQPDFVICMGEAGGRSYVSLENIALNLQEAPIPDNMGNQPMEQPVVPGGPQFYSATLPVKHIFKHVTSRHLPIEMSYSAGTFVCNDVFYGLMHLLTLHPDIRGGFVHVPYTFRDINADSRGMPALDEQIVVETVCEIIRSLDNLPHVNSFFGGRIC